MECRASAIGTDESDFLASEKKACLYYKNGWFERFREVGDPAFEKFREAHPECIINEQEIKEK